MACPFVLTLVHSFVVHVSVYPSMHDSVTFHLLSYPLFIYPFIAFHSLSTCSLSHSSIRLSALMDVIFLPSVGLYTYIH